MADFKVTNKKEQNKFRRISRSEDLDDFELFDKDDDDTSSSEDKESNHFEFEDQDENELDLLQQQKKI